MNTVKARSLMSSGQNERAYKLIMSSIDVSNYKKYPSEILLTAAMAASSAAMPAEAIRLASMVVQREEERRKRSPESEYVKLYALALTQHNNGQEWKEATHSVGLLNLENVPSHTRQNFPIS